MKIRTKNLLADNQGYILIAALMALLILTAVGALVFTITTKDIRVTTRVIGEKKAFSAVQAGVHSLVLESNKRVGLIEDYTQATTKVDNDGDPSTEFVIGDPDPVLSAEVPPVRLKAGCDASADWKEKITTKSVTGTNTRYNSSITTDVGIGYGCVNVGVTYN